MVSYYSSSSEPTQVAINLSTFNGPIDKKLSTTRTLGMFPFLLVTFEALEASDVHIDVFVW